MNAIASLTAATRARVRPRRRGRYANLSSRKAPVVRVAVQGVGSIPLLLSYSPDFNPIQQLFTKLHADPRKLAERSAHGP